MNRLLRRLANRFTAGSVEHQQLVDAGRPVRWVSMGGMSEALDHEVIRAILPDPLGALSLLDVGCGNGARTRWIECARSTFLDVSRSPDAPEPFVQGGALEFLRGKAGSYDIIVCLDMIEHLERPAGEELIHLVQQAARRLALFFTPLGPMLINPADPTGHRSGWWPEDFEALGYHTWAFPRFHDPWMDGNVWGAFYAWRWVGEEPAAQRRAGKLAGRLGLTRAEAGVAGGVPPVESAPETLDPHAAHWRALWQEYRPHVFR